VISALARAALRRRESLSGQAHGTRVGRFALLPVRDEIVTVQRVCRLLDGLRG